MNKVLKQLYKRKRFFFFSFLRIASMVFGLISNIFIVRKLSVEDYGLFSVALLVVNLITTFGFSWSSSSILYFGSREKNLYGSINKTFWARNIIIFFSLIIVTMGIIIFRQQIDDYVGLNVWYLLLPWLYVSVIENYLNQYYLAIKKQITSSMLSITAKLLYIALLIFVPFDVKTLIIIYIISHASVILYILGINKADIGKYEFDRHWFKQVFDFSIWQLFGFSGIYLINFGGIAVVKYFMTNYEVGLYNAAYQLFTAVASFSFVISSYYASNISAYFAGAYRKKIKDFYYKERFLIFSISLAGHLILIVISKPLITLLFGIEYIKSAEIFNILMLSSILRYLTVFYMLYYNTNGKHKIQQLINIFVAVINLVLSIIFINIFGLYGPAIATVITFLLSLTYSAFYCEKRIKSFVQEGRK
jgi:O-antigen/teichoic acid export membrane protein